MALSSTEAEYVALSACTQEVNFFSVLLKEMNEVQKPSVIYEYNQGAVFLVKNRQVDMRTKHIDGHHHFLRDMVEGKDVNIQYIRREDKPADIMTKNTTEADFVKQMNSITEGELWKLVYTKRENVKNTRVTDDVINRDKTKYSSHALAEVVDGDHMIYWILVTRSRICK